MERANKDVLIKQIILLPICLFIGYVFASLFNFNEVTYVNISERIHDMVPYIFILSLMAYIIMSALVCTNIWKRFFNIINPFYGKFEYNIVIYATILFFIFYSLYLRQPCDYPVHTDWAINVLDWRNPLESIILIPYPLWHILVNLTTKVFYVPAIYSAAIISAGFHSLEYLIIFNIICELNTDILAESHNVEGTFSKIALFSFVLMFVQPIYIPWFNTLRFLGQGTPNIWDNPTQVAVYPFALIVTFLFLKLLHKMNNSQKIYRLEYLQLAFYSF